MLMWRLVLLAWQPKQAGSGEGWSVAGQAAKH